MSICLLLPSLCAHVQILTPAMCDNTCAATLARNLEIYACCRHVCKYENDRCETVAMQLPFAGLGATIHACCHAYTLRDLIMLVAQCSRATDKRERAFLFMAYVMAAGLLARARRMYASRLRGQHKQLDMDESCGHGSYPPPGKFPCLRLLQEEDQEDAASSRPRSLPGPVHHGCIPVRFWQIVQRMRDAP